MSDPVRITNPGAESLGYDSDGHEIMAVDIYVNPPRVDVFHGTPPAWSSFGNKTIWGGNEWVDDSPTRSDIEKRDKEITAYKNTLSVQQKENENKRTEAGKRLSAAIAAREKDENTLKTLRAGNADVADITRQEFRLLQAELRECQRQDYWPFFAIFNVRYWSLMLSAFRHFIITDWRGVFCQHSRFAFFL